MNVTTCACGCGIELDQSHSGANRKWASERCRKSQYAGACDICGGPTCGSDGRAKAPTRCAKCIVWTEEEVLAAITEWAADLGRTPRVVDMLGIERAAKRYYGSWNNAILAAGLRVNKDTSPETLEDIRCSVRAGESTKSIAARYGIGESAVHNRLKTSGTSVKELRKMP